MAVPVVVVKAIAVAATDKRTWNLLAVLIAAVLMPIILVVLMTAALFSGAEKANQSLLDYSFQNVEIPKSFTSEQVSAIENMRLWLAEIDTEIEEINVESADTVLDENLVKAAFYSLQFGFPMPINEDGNEVEFDYKGFCECFAGKDIERIDVALEYVSERFPQYEVTKNQEIVARKGYEYLNGSD